MSTPKRGRPAPLGRKVVASVRLTPDVDQCLREQPEGLVTLEIVFRRSKLFKDWLKSRENKGN